MLFLLTGDVQIGKTRWLENLCASLQAAGTCVAGVVAPGQWAPRPEGQPGGKHGFDGAGRFEKLGIDNVLLPQGERIEFARRRDLAAGGKAFAEGAQAKAAKLGWAISDTAIAQVNAHFATLAKQAANETRLAPHAMLVVDELGRLELLRGCGLTNALAILDAGPTPQFPHAIAVVRETLLDEARRRFEPHWGKVTVIGPDDAARNLVLETARAAGGAHRAAHTRETADTNPACKPPQTPRPGTMRHTSHIRFAYAQTRPSAAAKRRSKPDRAQGQTSQKRAT